VFVVKPLAVEDLEPSACSGPGHVRGIAGAVANGMDDDVSLPDLV